MYVMVCTRSGISNAISVVSIFMANLRKEHWIAEMWIFCYQAVTNFVIMFDHEKAKSDITGFVNADHVRDLDSRISTTGFMSLSILFVEDTYVGGQFVAHSSIINN